LKSITLEATINNVNAVTAFVDELLEENDCSMKANMQIDIIIDELFGNIANYAYAPDTGEATVSVDFLDEPKRVAIAFEDSGVPYDPLKKDDPDITLSAEERDIGGLGIFMVKSMVEEIKYEFENGKNILTIIKKI